MKLGLIGVGQAGGKISERMLEYDEKNETEVVKAVTAINSAKADLMGLKKIRDEQKVLIGQARVKGHGVGADNELGATIAEEDIDEIQSSIDRFPVHELDAFLIICGLGGGTGSGGAPVIAKHLRKIYEEPVYGLGILPDSDEGGIYSLNAARSFKTLTDAVDNLILFDNGSWKQTNDSVADSYVHLNTELVTRLGMLFSAGEVSPNSDVGETVVDASEIINTLNSSGISSIGYATAKVENNKNTGLLQRLRGSSSKDSNSIDSGESVNRITSLTRKATLGRLTLPVDTSRVEKALLVVSGPPDKINRKGVEKARKWIEQECGSMEVRGGDYPKKYADQIEVSVLLSGVTSSDRIKELQGIAIEAQDTKEEIRQNSPEDLDDLIKDEDDQLDALF